MDGTEYGSGVVLKFHIKPDMLPALQKKLADATAGEVQIQTENEDYFPSAVIE